MSSNQLSSTIKPLVTVVMSAHDRQHLLPMALACYRHQTYPNRELIVVDDSEEPIDSAAVAGVGGRLIRMEPGTPLGIKLNRGLLEARGLLCQKKDDDDWYAPDFLEKMVVGVMEERELVCKPIIGCLMPFVFFDVARWELRIHVEAAITGASFIFFRADWEDVPFRGITTSEDHWFFSDQNRSGAMPIGVEATDSFLQVRHRGHLWTGQWNGAPLEEYISTLPVYDKTPEQLLPSWAVEFFRSLQRQLLAGPARSA